MAVLCSDAAELYSRMGTAIRSWSYFRVSGDSKSPAQQQMREAELGMQFKLLDTVNCTLSGIDARWAVASILHFFAATEEASSLLRYNSGAARFLTDGVWEGAYGAQAMYNLGDCCDLLKESPRTRRAVVAMEGYDSDIENINRPACWNTLHFLLNAHGRLDMLVYQRSLHLTRVMPYDLLLFSNIMHYASERAGLPQGDLIWTIGSLHCDGEIPPRRSVPQHIQLPVVLLRYPNICSNVLNDPSIWDYAPYSTWLQGGSEVRL